MIAMRMVHTSVDDIVDMIAMRDRVMTASRSVRMTPALHIGCAPYGRIGVHRDNVFVNMVAMHVVQMPLMKIVQMTIVTDGLVTAIWAVLVRMLPWVLLRVGGHVASPFAGAHATMRLEPRMPTAREFARAKVDTIRKRALN
jgi:hypothetical protein